MLVDDAIFSISFEQYTLLCLPVGIPDNYADYRERARLVEEFELDNENGMLCFLGVKTGGNWPFLVIAQRYDPAGFGFYPAATFIPETEVLFVGAGRRLLAYDLGETKRLWEDQAECGFFNWQRHEDTVVMSAELELAAWDIHGHKLWSAPVEPPWEYSVNDGVIHLEVMGVHSRFDLRTGPLK